MSITTNHVPLEVAEKEFQLSEPPVVSAPAGTSNHVPRTQRTLDKVGEKYFSKVCHQAAWERFNRTILEGMNLTFDLRNEGQQICFYCTSLMIDSVSG